MWERILPGIQSRWRPGRKAAMQRKRVNGLGQIALPKDCGLLQKKKKHFPQSGAHMLKKPHPGPPGEKTNTRLF